MRVKLAYGKDGLWAELPDRNVTVVEPKYVPAVPDEREALRKALRAPVGTSPVRELAGPMIRWLSFSAISPVPSLAG